MKRKVVLITIISIFMILFIFVINKSFLKGTKSDNSFPYGSDVVDNLASAMASESGCGAPEYFVYQLEWGSVYMNNYNRTVGISNPITTSNMCTAFKNGYTSLYCNYNFDKLAQNRGGYCSTSQTEQLRLAARLVLAQSFTLPKNIYFAAEPSVISTYNASVFDSYFPSGGTWKMNYGYNGSLSTTDIYGYPVSTDVNFYHTLANCLLSNPTYYAHNQCGSGSSVPNPTNDDQIGSGGNDSPSGNYNVYLFPNGGVGITDNYTITYSDKKYIADFPSVTKDGCTLNGWSVGSVTSSIIRTQYVDKEEDGEKLFANWKCLSGGNDSTITDNTGGTTGGMTGGTTGGTTGGSTGGSTGEAVYSDRIKGDRCYHPKGTTGTWVKIEKCQPKTVSDAKCTSYDGNIYLRSDLYDETGGGCKTLSNSFDEPIDDYRCNAISKEWIFIKSCQNASLIGAQCKYEIDGIEKTIIRTNLYDETGGGCSLPMPTVDNLESKSFGADVSGTNNYGVKNSSNVGENVKTGTTVIAIAWFVGITALVGSFYYFKKNYFING